MNQLGFFVSFIFTTLIAVSTPNDISFHQARQYPNKLRCWLKSLNESCTAASDCCSDLCEPVNGQKQCSCIAEGATTGRRCRHFDQCCTGACRNGVCTCDQFSKSCLQSSQCCSGVCEYKGRSLDTGISFQCTCKPKDANCTADVECCTGNCCKGACGCGRDYKKIKIPCKTPADCCGHGAECPKIHPLDTWGYCKYEYIPPKSS